METVAVGRTDLAGISLFAGVWITFAGKLERQRFSLKNWQPEEHSITEMGLIFCLPSSPLHKSKNYDLPRGEKLDSIDEQC